MPDLLLMPHLLQYLSWDRIQSILFLNSFRDFLGCDNTFNLHLLRESRCQIVYDRQIPAISSPRARSIDCFTAHYRSAHHRISAGSLPGFCRTVTDKLLLLGGAQFFIFLNDTAAVTTAGLTGLHFSGPSVYLLTAQRVILNRILPLPAPPLQPTPCCLRQPSGHPCRYRRQRADRLLLLFAQVADRFTRIHCRHDCARCQLTRRRSCHTRRRTFPLQRRNRTSQYRVSDGVDPGLPSVDFSRCASSGAEAPASAPSMSPPASP